MCRLTAAVAIYLTCICATAPVMAAPAEPPPRDFAADQYIDSAGCVFTRQDGAWIARTDRDGAPICGYPPSVASAAAPADEPPDPDSTRQQASTALAEALAAGLRNGEVQGGVAPAATRRPMPLPTGVGPAAEIAARAEAAPALREAIARGARPNDRLCELLGGDVVVGGTAQLGNDPTRGMCSGLPDSGLSPRISAADAVSAVSVPVAPAVAEAVKPDQPAGVAPPAPKPLSVAGATAVATAAAPRQAQTAAQPPATAPAAALTEPAKPAETASRAVPSAGELIPATARYVQLGWFTDETSATAVIRQVAAMGLPVARSRKIDPKSGRLVLSGPFPDRRDLLIALRQLRNSGFAGAMPR